MNLDRILVAVSFSERSIDALRQAAGVAARRHAGLTLLHVVEPLKRRALRRLPAQQTLLHARVAHARRMLARLAGEIAATRRIAVEFRIEIGEKVSSILGACAEADLLCIGGAIRSTLMAALHMTTVERLMGCSAIPVLLVSGPTRFVYHDARPPAAKAGGRAARVARRRIDALPPSR